LSETVAVVVIHPDVEVQRWLRQALPEGEFGVVVRSQSSELQAELRELRPQVVLIDAALAVAERGLCHAALGLDPPALLLALAAREATTTVDQALACGADDVIVLPLSDALLRSKLRAGVRLLRRALSTREVRGEIGPEGALTLIKHCEDHRLSGRLTVEGNARRYWADFFGGELLSTGSDSTADDDDLAELMSLREGSYVFVQTAVEPLAATRVLVDDPLSVSRQAAEAALPPPETVVTTIAAAPQEPGYEVRTSGDNRPSFTITTSVVRDGHVLRETETSWPHPIESQADLAQARVQMGQQHERVTAKLREVAEPLLIAAPAPAMPGGVDGTLLSWALHFVVEQAWADLGTTVTANLLGRTQSALRRDWPHLAHFRIGDKAQVTFDLGHGATLASDAVDAVANWLAAFLYLARRVAPDVGKIDVHQSTLLMATALDQVGFYGAFSSAAARCERDGVQLVGTPIERGPERARLDYALAAGGSTQASRSNSSR
jgi:DNA-binding response OmpR family regulator